MWNNNINNHTWYDLRREEIISLELWWYTLVTLKMLLSKFLVCKAIGCKQSVTPKVLILGKALCIELFQSASLQNAQDNHAPLGPYQKDTPSHFQGCQ